METMQLITCPCNHCGGHLESASDGKGQTVKCPHCGENTVLFEPATESPPAPALSATKKKKGELLGVGCLVQVAGIVCMFIQFPFGIIPGLILLVVGGRMAIKLICSECGNKTSKEAKICATCGARFDK